MSYKKFFVFLLFTTVTFGIEKSHSDNIFKVCSNIPINNNDDAVETCTTVCSAEDTPWNGIWICSHPSNCETGCQCECICPTSPSRVFCGGIDCCGPAQICVDGKCQFCPDDKPYAVNNVCEAKPSPKGARPAKKITSSSRKQ